MKVLVVGGAGYIGSHMVKMLAQQGCETVVLDNLSYGHRDAVKGGRFIHGDLADIPFLMQLFQHERFDAVMHFASFIQVGESVQQPAKYYQNNVANTLNLLNTMVAHGVLQFIFSSTAAVFGEPQYTPIDEKHPKLPINPYGRSKWMIEQVLEDYELAYGLRSMRFRYFNAAGADPLAELGERHEPETHLIPLILQVASGRRKSISVFGRDYETVDGTCIRDYVHIVDLCQAHWLGLKALSSGATSQAYNLGNGQGFSVQQVIDAALKVTGKPIEVISAPRRAGDPAVLVADSALVKNELGWMPQYAELETIVQHAWNWELKQCS